MKWLLHDALAMAPLGTPREMKASGFPRPRLPHSSTKCGGQRHHPGFCIACQASMVLCLSIRLRVIDSGGRGGTQLEVHTQNNTLCNRRKEFLLIQLDQILTSPWMTRAKSRNKPSLGQ